MVVTSEENKTKEEKHLVTALRANGYQKWTIDLAQRQKQAAENKDTH